jgi:hypothetical protein
MTILHLETDENHKGLAQTPVKNSIIMAHC